MKTLEYKGVTYKEEPDLEWDCTGCAFFAMQEGQEARGCVLLDEPQAFDCFENQCIYVEVKPAPKTQVFRCQSPAIDDLFTVIYLDGSGGYQCRDDMQPAPPMDLVHRDPIKLQLLRAAFNNAYRMTTGKEWEAHHAH